MDLNKDLYQKDKLDQKPTRDGYGEGLVELGEKNPNLVVLCADLTNSTRSNWFKEKFPERFIEVGIAEQNMLGIATGLALQGKIPFISTYSVFSPGLNWCQLRLAAYGQVNIKVTGAHAGVSVGADGATHQGLEDIATVRCIPEITVLAPSDYLETKKATIAAAKMKGPVYLRFAREATPVFTTKKTPFKIGRAEVFRKGADATIIACGPTVYEALLAADDLEEENNLSVGVINNHTIKPIDQETIIEAAKKTGAMVTAEDHQVQGGMGSAVAEVLAKDCPVPIEMIGVQDRWGESGSPEELMKEFHLVAEDIKEAVKKVLKRKS